VFRLCFLTFFDLKSLIVKSDLQVFVVPELYLFALVTNTSATSVYTAESTVLCETELIFFLLRRSIFKFYLPCQFVPGQTQFSWMILAKA